MEHLDPAAISPLFGSLLLKPVQPESMVEIASQLAYGLAAKTLLHLNKLVTAKHITNVKATVVFHTKPTA